MFFTGRPRNAPMHELAVWLLALNLLFSDISAPVVVFLNSFSGLDINAHIQGLLGAASCRSSLSLGQVHRVA